MKSEAIDQATIRLKRMRDQLPLLKNDGWTYSLVEPKEKEWTGDTPISEEQKYETQQAWEAFLIAAAGVYSKLLQGAKGKNQSEAWFAKRVHDRRTDPLLAYIHQARNCEEHGLDSTTAAQSISFFPPEGQMRGSGPQVLPWRSDMKEGETIARTRPPRIILTTVKDGRSGKVFHPPELHFDKPILTDDPYDIAILACVYLETVINEAQSLEAH